MTSPYRALFIEPLPEAPGAGHCPWCRATVSFNANSRLAVCHACDATFATSIASVTEAIEDEAGPFRGPIAWVVPVQGVVAGRIAMVLFFAFELALIVTFFAALS